MEEYPIHLPESTDALWIDNFGNCQDNFYSDDWHLDNIEIDEVNHND